MKEKNILKIKINPSQNFVAIPLTKLTKEKTNGYTKFVKGNMAEPGQPENQKADQQVQKEQPVIGEKSEPVGQQKMAEPEQRQPKPQATENIKDLQLKAYVDNVAQEIGQKPISQWTLPELEEKILELHGLTAYVA